MNKETVKTFFSNPANVRAYYDSELNLKWNGSGQGISLCPFHEDSKASLSVKDTGAFFCHACNEKGGDVIGFHMARHGLDFKAALSDLAAQAGISGRMKQQKSLTLADIQKITFDGYTFDRYHTYKAGKPEYIKAIFKNLDGDKKALFYTITGNGLYVSGRESKPVFYNQERITDIIKAVCLSESEKDSDTLFTACNLLCISSGGATSWSEKLPIEILKNKSAILLPHHDEPGRKYAETAAQSLNGVAASIKIVDPEIFGAQKGADVSDWIQAGGSKGNLLEIINKAPEWEKTPPLEQEGQQRDSPYFIDDNGNLCRWKQLKDGFIDEKLSNFNAWISREVLLDDGRAIEQFFEIEGKRGETALRPIQIKTSQFQAMNWIIENWGNQAVIEAGQAKKDFIRHYIQTQSGNAQRQVIYCHTGWREINGKWVYLSGNGAIGGDTGICVDLSRKHLAERYELPLIPENEIEAIKTSLSLLDVADRRISIPLYSLVFLSAVTTLLKPMPMFSGGYLNGHTGVMKTTLACLFNCHFGDITSERLMNFESTKNSIIEKMSYLKDCIMILDDYRPTHNRQDAEKMEGIAQGAIRLSANRATRERLNSDSTFKPSSEPKGMVLITGEELVKLPSTLARTMILEVGHGDIDLNRLTELQAQTSLLPHAMTSFILWVRDNMPDIKGGFYPQFIQLRAKAASNNIHSKLIEQMAYLQYAMTLITSWLLDKGILSDSEASEMQAETWSILNNQAKRQAQIMEHGDPLNSFFEMFNTWIVQGKIKIEDKDGLPANFIGGITGEFLGYYDDFHFYLFPAALWNYLQRYCIAQGEHFPFSKHTFYKMLKDRKLIEADKDHNTKTERLKGELKKVLKILRQGVYPEKR